MVPTFGTLPYANPIGDGEAIVALSHIGLLPFLFVLGTGAAALVVRFRRSRGDERQQLKWLALAASWMAVSIAIFASVAIAQGSSGATGFDWAENLVVLSFFFAIPVAIGIGVLKYRLYDIDVVINRAIVYGALAVFITGIYVGIVAGVGAAVGTQGDALLSAIAAAIVALAFQPARRWAQRLANRLVYGRRATPYEVLSELSSRFAETYSLEDSLPRLARVTAEAVGAERTRIWLRSNAAIRTAASWPSADAAVAVPATNDPVELDGDRAFAVRHQGELLGAISVRMPPSEPLGAPHEKLVRDVAAHAGLVLRNVALVDDLRASRQRIVTAQDERARKLERDIHDGAQQQMVALAVKLRVAEQLARKDADKTAAMLQDLQREATEALDNMRDLARGIYPPLLADKGLAAAIEEQARKSPIAVSVEADGVGRYPQEVEATAYFCALEAMQNVMKYAHASRVSVRLSQRDGALMFAVEDDGVGFDPQAARGSGLTNMRDRLEAVGGRLDVRSMLGGGTTVSGRIPADGRELPP